MIVLFSPLIHHCNLSLYLTVSLYHHFLFLTGSSLMPSFTCFLSCSLELPAYKLFQTCFPILHASFSPCHCLNQGTCQATSACLLSLSACCPVVAATFWHCTHVKGGEIATERERARGEEERQGNKGMHADAGPISFTNMQILLPL